MAGYWLGRKEAAKRQEAVDKSKASGSYPRPYTGSKDWRILGAVIKGDDVDGARASFTFVELLWNEKMAKHKVFFGKSLCTFIRSLL